ncbi:MAG TPA: hypothetical protein VHW46_07285, partial [Terracidiphilus sp.]|nr:hypothetical protein [Terracidiphilus sp.]
MTAAFISHEGASVDFHFVALCLCSGARRLHPQSSLVFEKAEANMQATRDHSPEIAKTILSYF